MSVNNSNGDFSTVKISPQLISQILDALKNKAFGSVEIYVENYTVTQITERTINKVCKSVKSVKPFSAIKTREEPQLPAS